MKKVKVGSVLIVKEDKFLLVKAKTGPGKGLWNNPGGRLEPGETYEKGAVREAREETGCDVQIGKLINEYHFKVEGRTVTKKVFEADISSGELSFPEDEIADVKWFSLEDITDELRFTFGAVQSIKDYNANKFGETYYPDRVA